MKTKIKAQKRAIKQLSNAAERALRSEVYYAGLARAGKLDERDAENYAYIRQRRIELNERIIELQDDMAREQEQRLREKYAAKG